MQQKKQQESMRTLQAAISHGGDRCFRGVSATPSSDLISPGASKITCSRARSAPCVFGHVAQSAGLPWDEWLQPVTAPASKTPPAEIVAEIVDGGV